MASKPGFLTDWPWQKLGSFKYMVVAPFVAHSVYSYCTKPEEEKDLSNLFILLLMLSRFIHNQIWISLSRFQTARSMHKIVQRSLDFEQVDRESNWDDTIILSAMIHYIYSALVPAARQLPMWRGDGVVLILLLHVGPVEFLYYWFHRALHHHYLYTRYHSHHHSSIVVEPITSVIHPFAEVLAYHLLFAIPILSSIHTGLASIMAIFGYHVYIDFMNNLGHCNFEFVPKWLFQLVFPPIKYLMYTPSFHSLHHTKFRTNYCLFMPMYDYLYGTTDITSDALYEESLKWAKERPNVVHLSHFTSLDSIYHQRLGFGSFSSKPYSSKWYMWAMAPLTLPTALVTWILGSTFTVESNVLDKLKMQTWIIPRFSFQYMLPRHWTSVNNLIEKAILDADKEGVKVISLGLLNQGEELNMNGHLFIKKYPNLKIRIVDGTALAVAIVLRTIPKGTKQVVLGGDISKAGYAIVRELCQKGFNISILRAETLAKMKQRLPASMHDHLFDLSTCITTNVWLVENKISNEEQNKALKGTHFIPFSNFPPQPLRRDCIYYPPPSMMVPSAFENLHSCENWLPRRAMSAPRIAGIVHAMEGWQEHECGHGISVDVSKAWKAATSHGFHHYYASSSSIMD